MKCEARTGVNCGTCNFIVDSMIDRGAEHYRGEDYAQSPGYLEGSLRKELTGAAKLVLDVEFPTTAVGLGEGLSCRDRQQRAADIAKTLAMREFVGEDNVVVLPTRLDYPSVTA